LEVWIGKLEIGVDAFALGCAERLDKVDPAERDAMANYIRRRLESKGLPSGVRVQEPSFRSELARELNAVTGRQIVTDVLLVTRYFNEYEIDPESENPESSAE
jgi:hypothetical protein